MGDTRERTVTLALQPRVEFRGRVRAPAEIDRGHILFVAADGTPLAAVDVDRDGTFTATQRHASPRYAVFTAANFPLAVMPLASDGTLELSLPTAPVRDLEITIAAGSAQTDAVPGLFVGGRYIPNEAFFRHQHWRGMQAILRGKGPLRVPPVVANGPIIVVLGPAPKDVTVRNVDELFIRRELLAGRPAKSPDANGRVIFD